jgi:hypothetical protein
LTLKDQITIGCPEINIKINVKNIKTSMDTCFNFFETGTKLSFNYFPRNEQATPKEVKKHMV